MYLLQINLGGVVAVQHVLRVGVYMSYFLTNSICSTNLADEEENGGDGEDEAVWYAWENAPGLGPDDDDDGNESGGEG